MTLRRLVSLVEIVALVAALTFVLLLFVNEPDRGGGSAPPTGAQIYSANCATCHGATGKGGVGPRLADLVVAHYPDEADEITVVAGGRNGMPSFSGRLSPEEIRAVVAYTRTDLGG